MNKSILSVLTLTLFVVHIKNFAFAPATLHVAPGDSVAFVNDDSEAHTATSITRAFDSAGLDTGDRWVHRFTKAGTYAYICALHPYMKGSIVVSPAGARK